MVLRVPQGRHGARAPRGRGRLTPRPSPLCVRPSAGKEGGGGPAAPAYGRSVRPACTFVVAIITAVTVTLMIIRSFRTRRGLALSCEVSAAAPSPTRRPSGVKLLLLLLLPSSSSSILLCYYDGHCLVIAFVVSSSGGPPAPLPPRISGALRARGWFFKAWHCLLAQARGVIEVCCGSLANFLTWLKHNMVCWPRRGG